MTKSNLNVYTFPFFNSVKQPLTAPRISNSYWNNGFDTLSVEITGTKDITLTVQGCINTLDEDVRPKKDTECEWTDLAVISAADYSMTTEISGKGIYFVGITGCSRIRLNVTSVSGKATILGNFSK